MCRGDVGQPKERNGRSEPRGREAPALASVTGRGDPQCSYRVLLSMLVVEPAAGDEAEKNVSHPDLINLGILRSANEHAQESENAGKEFF